MAVKYKHIMKKISLIFPFAPIYRAPIYRLIDKNFDCKWYFCRNPKEKLKFMDYTELKKSDLCIKEHFIYKDWGYYTSNHDIDYNVDYVFLPQVIRNFSVWWILIKLRLFYPQTKVIIWGHGAYGWESKIQLLIKRLFFHLADMVLVYGNFSYDLMIKHGLCKKDSLHIIYNSLDYDKQKKLRNSLGSSVFHDHFHNKFNNIIFIGRLTKIKNLDYLLEALAILKNNLEYYNVTFVGDGAMKHILETFAKDKGLIDNVWFYGETYSEEEISLIVNSADLCVSPGNVGLTAMHALTYGTPVITHDRFELQMPEFEAIKKRITGDFYKYGSVESLASTISNWFKSHPHKDNVVYSNCISCIDTCWNPHNQLNILKSIL